MERKHCATRSVVHAEGEFPERHMAAIARMRYARVGYHVPRGRPFSYFMHAERGLMHGVYR